MGDLRSREEWLQRQSISNLLSQEWPARLPSKSQTRDRQRLETRRSSRPVHLVEHDQDLPSHGGVGFKRKVPEFPFESLLRPKGPLSEERLQVFFSFPFDSDLDMAAPETD